MSSHDRPCPLQREPNKERRKGAEDNRGPAGEQGVCDAGCDAADAHEGEQSGREAVGVGRGHVTRSTTAPAGIDPASVVLARVPPVVR